jgi:hypothetical protein
MQNRKQFPGNNNSAFGIHIRLGNSIKLIPRLQQLGVCRYLSYLPKEIVDFVVDNYVLIGMDENELGSQYQFDHPYFLGKSGFILLSSELWRRKPIEKAMVIAHEVAHAVIHNKFVRDKRNIFEKRLEMEEEANKLAIKWLEKRYSKERLQRICNRQY